MTTFRTLPELGERVTLPSGDTALIESINWIARNIKVRIERPEYAYMTFDEVFDQRIPRCSMGHRVVGGECQPRDATDDDVWLARGP